MRSIYGEEYGDRYQNNKYIWENSVDKNSPAAQKAHAENEEIRRVTGVGADTMDYEAFRNARANYSDYYNKAQTALNKSEYKKEIDNLYEAINNFSYNPETDKEYIAFAKAAERQSASAQKSAYANMTKLSGGRNSSYAAAATSQVAQNYAWKVNEYAQTLADKAYDRLVAKYNMLLGRQSQINNEAQMYMQMGDTDVANKRAALESEREIKSFEQDYKLNELKYSASLDEYKTQLINNKILNEKNQYEFEKWKQDPYYQIKDTKLAEAIGRYMGYSWTKNNGRDFLYSKFY